MRPTFKTRFFYRRFQSVVVAILVFTLFASFSRSDDADDGLLLEAGKGNELGLMTVRVRQAEDDKPIVDASIKVRGHVKQRINRTVNTDRNGEVVIDFEPNTTIRYFSIEIKKDGFVPFYARWDNRSSEVKLAALKTVKLEKGNPLSGVIVDEAGKPIKNARVHLRLPATEYASSNFVFTLADLTTDAKGEWQVDNAPKKLSDIFYSAEHDDYLRAGAQVTDFSGNRLVMKMGKRISGLVVDTDGKPITGAQLMWGQSSYSSNRRNSTTDANGRFVIKNGPDGSAFLTVTAGGFAPQMQTINVTKKTKPFRFELQPGNTIRGQVVDQAGKPVVGAFAASEYWRGQQVLRFRVNTDKDGRFQWNDAPADLVQFSIGKQGMMSARNVPLIAQEKEHTVTLNPVLEISGSVVDAVDGSPIAEVKVTRGTKFPGNKDIYWRERESFMQNDGQYVARYSEPSDGHFLRFESKAHETFQSREFKSDEGKVTFDVKLKRRDVSNYLNGIVRLPDGQPAKQISIYPANNSRRPGISNGTINPNSNAKSIQTDDDGRFSIPKPKEKGAIVVAIPEGFAIVSTDGVSEIEIQLQPWGRIEGRFSSASGDSAGHNLQFSRQHSREEQQLYNFIWTDYRTTTKPGGRFSIPFVVPGEGYLSRTVSRSYGDGTSSSYPGWHKKITVKSGKTTLVKYGGNGRKVTGRLVFETKDGTPHDWSFNEPIYLNGAEPKPDVESGSRRGWRQRYLAIIDEDGVFTIEDVPAGDYELATSINGSGRSGIWGASGGGIGKLTKKITVREDDSGDIDLGTITAQRFPTLEVGDTAPSFQINDLNGESISRKLLHGKIVLIEFVQPDGRGVQGFTNVARQVHKKYKDNDKVRVVTFACHYNLEQVKTTVKGQSVDWQVAHAQGLWSQVPKRFKIRRTPTTMLIGPGSKIAMLDAKPEKYLSEIEAMLGRSDLFEAAKADGPLPRFTLTSFSDETSALEETQVPAVVVFADTDPGYDAIGDDQLYLLSSDGGLLTSIGGMHTAPSYTGGSQVCVDSVRKRVYVCENIATQITAFDFQFRRIWQLKDVACDNMMLDPTDGNLWVSGGDSPQVGETVLISPEGKEIAAMPIRALAMAYQPSDDSFWLVGPRLMKMNRDREIVFEQKDFSGVATTVQLDDELNQVCIGVPNEFFPQHPHRILRLSNAGELLDEIDMGKNRPYRFTVTNGEIWVSTFEGIFRIQKGQTDLEKIEHVAHSVTHSLDGSIWISNDKAVLKLDHEGTERSRFDFPATPTNSSVISLKSSAKR